MKYISDRRFISGTPIFDGEASARGYALNKMCYSFNMKKNRDEFLGDEVTYCQKYGLDDYQISAIINRDILALIKVGGGVYFLGKLAGGVLGLDMQDIGAIQTGMTKEEFRNKLFASGK